MEYTEKLRPVTQRAVDTIDGGPYLDEMSGKLRAYSNQERKHLLPYLAAVSASEWRSSCWAQATRWRSQLPNGGIVPMEEYVIGTL